MRLLIVCLVAIFTSTASGCIEQEREFVPIFFTEEGLREERDSLNVELIQNIQKVFKIYKIDHRVENGRVFYKENIDKELLWNYTTKARDTEWLKTHR